MIDLLESININEQLMIISFLQLSQIKLNLLFEGCFQRRKVRHYSIGLLLFPVKALNQMYCID